MKKREIPSRLAELRERDYVRYKEACRRGGRIAARKRNKAIQSPAGRNHLAAEFEEVLATVKLEQAIRDARHAAFERRDHLLPDP